MEPPETLPLAPTETERVYVVGTTGGGTIAAEVCVLAETVDDIDEVLPAASYADTRK